MEFLRTIYPYTLYVLYATAFFAAITMFILLLKTLNAVKSLKVTLEPVTSIKTQVNEITEKKDYLEKNIADKNSQVQQFLKQFGLFLAAWHLIFPKKSKRRR